MTNPVVKKEISARMSSGFVTSKEYRGGVKKKSRQRTATTETTAEETKFPTRDCNTITIRKAKPVTLRVSWRRWQTNEMSPIRTQPRTVRKTEGQILRICLICPKYFPLSPRDPKSGSRSADSKGRREPSPIHISYCGHQARQYCGGVKPKQPRLLEKGHGGKPIGCG